MVFSVGYIMHFVCLSVFRNHLCAAVFPVHLQPVCGLQRGDAPVGGPHLLHPFHHHLPVRLGLHADLPPVAHPRAGDVRTRQGGAYFIQVRGTSPCMCLIGDYKWPRWLESTTLAGISRMLVKVTLLCLFKGSFTCPSRKPLKVRCRICFYQKGFQVQAKNHQLSKEPLRNPFVNVYTVMVNLWVCGRTLTPGSAQGCSTHFWTLFRYNLSESLSNSLKNPELFGFRCSPRSDLSKRTALK